MRLPLKESANEVLRVRASELPLPVADEPAPVMVHWLFDRVPAPFSTMAGSSPVPASLTRYSALPGCE